MKTWDIQQMGAQPVIVQGCMRMPELSTDAAARVIRCAFDLGVTFFDHAVSGHTVTRNEGVLQ